MQVFQKHVAQFDRGVSRFSKPATVSGKQVVRRERPASKPFALPPSVPRANPRLLQSVLVAAVVCALVGGAWCLFPGGPVHPEARYLPDGCNLFVSLRWPEVVQGGMAGSYKDMPGLIFAERCRVFLFNAGLGPEAVERVNGGRAADGSGTLAVYRLTRDVRPEEILDRPVFSSGKKSRYQKETIRGIPVYVFTAGATAIAFPERRVIVTGETELLRRTLSSRWGRSGSPLGGLLAELNFSAASVVASVGSPKPFAAQRLQHSPQLPGRITGTTDAFFYGPTIRCVRTFHIDRQPAAAELQQALQNSISAASKDPKTSEAARALLAAVQVSSPGDKARVQMEVSLQRSQFSAKSLETLGRLF